MFEKPGLSPHDRPRSKDSILREVDKLRALARRTRRLASAATNEADRNSLTHDMKELEANAARLEKMAVDAKSG